MTSSQESRLDEIFADFLQKQEAGEAVEPDDLIAAHPEFAAEITF